MLYKIIDMQNKLFYLYECGDSDELKKVSNKTFKKSKCIWIRDNKEDIIMKKLNNKWEDLRFHW